MQKKYSLIFWLSIAMVFLLFHIFDKTEEKLLAGNNPPPASRTHQPAVSNQPAVNNDVVAAILIMPKSYLPALKRFSHSKLAKNIKILPAQIRLKDGEMTAVHKNVKKKTQNRAFAPSDDVTNNTLAAGLESLPKKEKQILATGFLYLLANVPKGRLFR